MAGFGLNLKLVLYLKSQCLTESLGFFNPPLLQAAKRYAALLRWKETADINRTFWKWKDNNELAS